MLVVKVELWPYGREEQARTLQQVVIANDGTGTHEAGNYDVWATPLGVHPHIVRDHEARAVYHQGRVEAFPRGIDQEHVIGLVSEALKLVPGVTWEQVNRG